MKLVSPKTLLVSLLGIVFVIMKIVTFDGMYDLLWVAFFGYLTIKSLIIAFSQEAYDKNVKEAYQGKVLYCDLFGKFAFIAADIPIITIILSGLLAVFCPITTVLLRIVLGVLLIIAVGYTIWFNWYVSKHARTRMEGDGRGAAQLTADEERAWKRSALCHNICLGIIVALGILYLIFGNPRIYMNNDKLENALTGLSSDSVTLEEVVPFEWTTIYTFDPYTPLDRIEQITGSKSPALKESTSEGMTHIVFTKNGRVVASICAYPSIIGYSLSFSGGKSTYSDYPDGGYSHIEYGDYVSFEVTPDDGIVKLYAFVEE